MALLDWISDAAGPVVKGRGVVLRPPRAGDYEHWAGLRQESYAYLQPWEPLWPEDDLTKAAFRRRLSIYAREMELGNAWPFFVFVQDGKTLAEIQAAKPTADFDPAWGNGFLKPQPWVEMVWNGLKRAPTP